MAARKSAKSNRRAKHKLLAHLTGLIDRNALDYAHQVTSLRPKSILVAVLTAFGLYSLIFSVGYYAWQEHNVRRLYAVRQKIKKIVCEHEEPTGMLWKLEPLITELGLGDLTAAQLISLSRERQVENMAVEDYCDLVQRIFSALDNSGQRTIPIAICTAIENNFRNKNPT